VPIPPLASSEATLHVGEFLPPLFAGLLYVPLYARRALTLRHEGRAVPAWRVASFVSAVVVLVVVQVPPFDTLADEVLLVHMIQHIIVGEICSLFIVIGLTGTMLAPLMRLRIARPLRAMANPVVALALWALDLYLWHLPLFYPLAIRHDLIHAVEHACLLWFGVMLWMGLLGPLPKPAWFEGWGGVGYVIGVRLSGAILANVFIWAQTVFYPVYKESDARHGLSPLSDQNLAGGAMMVVQIVLTTLLLCWLFMRFAKRDEERQAVMDLAAEHGVALSNEREARAAATGTTGRLRERVLLEAGEERSPTRRGGSASEQDGAPVP
jgi:cytochrome c oxidase assembly factor CtaG